MGKCNDQGIKMTAAILAVLTWGLQAEGAGLDPSKLGMCPFEAKKFSGNFESSSGGAHEELSDLAVYAQQFSSMGKAYGKCLNIKRGDDTNIELEFKDVHIPIRLEYSEKGKVKLLSFFDPIRKSDSKDDIIRRIEREDGKFSLLLRSEKGDALMSHNTEVLLPLSRSAFLILFAKVRDLVKKSKMSLDKTYPLASIPTGGQVGISQYWKAGTKVSLDTLMNLLIVDKDLSAEKTLLQALQEHDGSFNKNYGKWQTAGSVTKMCELMLEHKKDYGEYNYHYDREFSQYLPAGLSAYHIIQSRDVNSSHTTIAFQLKSNGAWYCLSASGENAEFVEESFFSEIVRRSIYLVLFHERYGFRLPN